MEQLHPLGHLSAVFNLEADIHYLGVEMELAAVAFQIFHHRQDHGLILVVLGKTQGAQIGQAVDVVDEALHIQLHFQGAVAIVEGEHGAPVGPEIGFEDLVVEDIGDPLIRQIFVGGEEQLHQFHGALVGDVELPVGMGVPALLLGDTAQGIVGVLLV